MTYTHCEFDVCLQTADLSSEESGNQVMSDELSGMVVIVDNVDVWNVICKIEYYVSISSGTRTPLHT